ncbi:MAG: sulfatase [Gammaproteobacteria bacterium]|nr:sulfatase [Gammaproteobacteria bacterium]
MDIPIGNKPLIRTLSVSVVFKLLTFLLSFLLVACSDSHQKLHVNTSRPNILLILADDLGFSDLGVYGSEIPTPNIDSLAESGTLLTNFYANATCAPSRSMLLSGMDSHSVGYGINPSAARRLPMLAGQPGYSGNWPAPITSFVNQFSNSNYYTFMAGKWHQGSGPKASPLARGFQKAFYLLEGGASHFSDAAGQTSAAPLATYFENDQPISALPSEFYSSRFYVSKIIDYLEQQKPDDDRPFFGYLAFTAPHWPLQVPDDWLNRFAGQYDEGWEATRSRRIEAAKQKGLIPFNTIIPPFPQALGRWSELDLEQQAREARRMELYASMIAYMDQQVGRLIEHLKASNQYKNTLIVFLSDNGPEGNDIELGLADNQDWLPARFNQSLANMGRSNSYVTFSRGWAHVSAGALSQYKSFLGEGGVRVPAIFSYPDHIESSRQFRSLMSMMDIAPTLMDFGKVTANQQFIMQGQSATRQLLNEADVPVRPHLAMETYGNKAVWKESLKLLWDWQDRGWNLYDLATDPGETAELGDQYPNEKAEMIEIFDKFAAANGVVVLQDEVGYARYADQIDSYSAARR